MSRRKLGPWLVHALGALITAGVMSTLCAPSAVAEPATAEVPGGDRTRSGPNSCDDYAGVGFRMDFTYVDPQFLKWEFWNCTRPGETPKTMRVHFRMRGIGQVGKCVEPGTGVPLSFEYKWNGQPRDQWWVGEIEFKTWEPKPTGCVPYGQQDGYPEPGAEPWHPDPDPVPTPPPPPCSSGLPGTSSCGTGPVLVTATGSVVAKRNGGSDATRPFADARFAAYYWGRDGEGTPEQWRPLLGADGLPVTGALEYDGRYQITFQYPNRHVRADGSTWVGCPDVGDGEAYAGAHACHDQHIEIRVLPQSREGLFEVKVPDEAEVVSAHNAKIGRFYQRPDEVHRANSPAAQAYTGILNVRDMAPRKFHSARIQLRHDDLAFYDSASGVVQLSLADAATSITEHELGHRLQHLLLGTDFRTAPNCSPHSFTGPSNEQCAFQEGFATWVSVVSENEPGSLAWTRSTRPTSFHELEHCASRFYEGNGQIVCGSPGNHVEGWVAAALWDLLDNTPLETKDGFKDGIGYDSGGRDAAIAEILDVVDDSQAQTFLEFWSARPGRTDAIDMAVAFLDQQLISGRQDAEVADAVGGDWREVLCGPCTGSSFLSLTPVPGRSPEVNWTFDKTGGAPPEHDIWVYVPPVLGARDTAAVYTVESEAGAHSFAVDQNKPGWKRINDEGVVLGSSSSTRITLTPGDPGAVKPLAADAVIVTPHMPLSQ